MVTVLMGWFEFCDAKAVIVPESIPPDRKTPTGTSLTILSLIDFAS